MVLVWTEDFKRVIRKYSNDHFTVTSLLLILFLRSLYAVTICVKAVRGNFY